MKRKLLLIALFLPILNACSSSGRFAVPPDVLLEPCIIERGTIETWRDLVVEYQNEKTAHEICAVKMVTLIDWLKAVEYTD